jgi:hypothetical protein
MAGQDASELKETLAGTRKSERVKNSKEFFTL